MKKRLSIAHIHWGFPPIIGGVETHLSIMLPEMARLKHRVSLLTGSVEGVKTKYIYKNVEIYRTPIMDLNWLYRRGLEALEEEIFRTFEDFLNKTKPDLVHAHNMHYFSRIHAKSLEIITISKGIPLVLTAHNVWDDILFLELTHHIKWSHIIAVSHFIKRELIGVGYEDKAITVIHHGIDTNIFRPDVNVSSLERRYPQLRGKRIIFHPARIGLAKGCDVSLKALNILKDKFPDVILVLGGSKNIIDWGETQQKDIAYLVDLVKLFKLRDYVLIDAFSMQQMPQLYAISKVCIYPSSFSEPFGLTMLEALSSAKPMIVTNSGGMPEIIQDGINGFIISIKDFEALALRVSQLFKDEKLCQRLGNKGRKIVQTHYTKQILTQNTLEVYKKVL